jgi:hypothetical protein
MKLPNSRSLINDFRFAPSRVSYYFTYESFIGGFEYAGSPCDAKAETYPSGLFFKCIMLILFKIITLKY